MSALHREKLAEERKAAFHRPNPWTDERVEKLRNLWSEGWSASEIARVLGPDFTRNAVIGKVHRLNLQKRATRVSRVLGAPRIAKTKRQREARVARMKSWTPKLPPAMPTHALPAEPLVEPPPLMLSIMDLTFTTCRWPIGDPKQPGFGFCGHPVADGAPYCNFHKSVAFHKPGKWEHRPKKARTFA